MAKKQLITEKEIAKLILERGIKCNEHIYKVPVLKSVIIEFDGRICVEDYEDLPCEAPCIVTCLWADAIKDHVYFTCATHFSTSFPSMYNDQYNLHVLDQKQYKQIVEYLNTIPKRKEKKKDYKVEWLKLADEYLGQYNWKCGNDDEECRYAWFKHSVDCWLCCDHNPFDNNIEKIIEDEYLSKLDDACMIALKMVYPNEDEFYDKMYLSHQTINRKIIQEKFKDMVMNKVWNTVSNTFIHNLWKQNPYDILKSRYKKLSFVFKDKIVFDKNIEIHKPSKHKPKKEYTKEDCSDNVEILDFWLGASYVLIHCNTDHNKYTYTPVILKNVEIKENIQFNNKIFELDPYNLKLEYSDYFSYDDPFGKSYIELTLQNQNNGEEIKIKWSSNSCYHQNNGYYYLQKHNPRYKYPTIENTYMKNILDNHISRVKEQFNNVLQGFKNLCEDKKYQTHNINNLKWTDNICVSCGYSWRDQCNIYNYSFKYKDIVQIIPNGYRLPTADEVVQLIKKYGMKYKKSTWDDGYYYKIGDITITDNHMHWRRLPGIWTSDTLSGEQMDPIKVIVTINGDKEYVRQDYSTNYLLLIKE